MAFIGPANWPDSLKLRECLANIFDNSINADVLFEVRTGNKNADGSNETEVFKFCLKNVKSIINLCRSSRHIPLYLNAAQSTLPVKLTSVKGAEPTQMIR